MFRAVFLLFALSLGSRFLGATTFVWIPNRPGEAWSNNSNWDPNGVPNGPTDTAVIGPNGAYAGMLDVELDLNVTLNTLELSPPSDLENFDLRLTGVYTLTITDSLITQLTCSIESPTQISNMTTVSVGNSQYLEFQTLLGSGGVELVGGGRLRFVGSGGQQSSYSGVTKILSGVYEAGVFEPTFSPNSAITIANDPSAIIIIQDTSQTLKSLEGGGALGGNVGLGTIGQSGTLTVGDATDRTYAGRIVAAWAEGSAKGRLIKQGAGTWTLAGANTHDEGTFLNEGGIVAANSQALGTGFLEMAPGTHLGLVDAVTITNPIQLSVSPSPLPVILEVSTGQATINASLTELGAGASFEKQGAGTLTIIGSCDLSGLSRIVEGALSVEGSWSTVDLQIEEKASLQGNGSFHDLSLAGRLQPGNSISTILADNLSLQSGSRFVVEVNKTGASALEVNQLLSIAPDVTLEVVTDRGAVPSVPQRIASATMLTGQFHQILSSPRVLTTVSYSPGAIDLLLDPVYWVDLLAEEGCYCCNVMATAAYLDELYFSPTRFSTDLDRVFKVLNWATPEQLVCALSQLSGSSYSVMPVAQQYTTLQILQEISDRLDQKRTLLGTHWSQSAVHTWTSVLGNQAHQSAESCGWKYCAYDTGFLLGLDIQQQSWITGVVFSYSSLYLKAEEAHLRGSNEAFYGHAYGRWNGEYLFGDVVIGGGYGFNRISRDYIFRSSTGSIVREACSHFGGEQFDLHLGIGAQASTSWIDWALIASVDYLHLSQPNFEELGAGALNLTLDSLSSDLLRSEVSLWASHVWGRHVPQIGLAVAYDWRANSTLFSGLVEFCSHQGNICCPAWTPNRWLFIPRAKWTELLSDRYSLSLSYEGQFAEHYWQNSLWIELGYAF